RIWSVWVPFGPFTDRMWPSVVAVTPAGSGTGLLPIRDILEHLREDFAAHVLRPRLGVGQNGLGRRDDGDAEAVAHAWQLLRARIDAAARFGDAGDVLDRGLALEIFQDRKSVV